MCDNTSMMTMLMLMKIKRREERGEITKEIESITRRCKISLSFERARVAQSI